jgi:thioredoxin 1
MSKVINVLAEDFKNEVEQHRGKVLVDFYAPWCGPCKMIAPIVKKIAEENKTVKVVKVNADESQELMAKFGIRGIPTLLLMNEGEIIATQVGTASVSQIKAFVEQ